MSLTMTVVVRKRDEPSTLVFTRCDKVSFVDGYVTVFRDKKMIYIVPEYNVSDMEFNYNEATS